MLGYTTGECKRITVYEHQSRGKGKMSAFRYSMIARCIEISLGVSRVELYVRDTSVK